ncbi:hypothetical protein [Streptomyces beihaiensis]|uniref:Uncharacterized protein n=1 Tax=Streptomyces beihaiensis TaxID=2984495 RepID=A0ABT3TVV7_9ACTN|nr:hypothetical protein [Streptomyces beihaiensis]MCX3061161.1 hypothetical protein [Streptomyces beihaiensis]
MLYNARITYWAMTCSKPGEPMIGGFATWRNAPITFDQKDTSSSTVQVGNYLRVSPNTEKGLFGPNIEIGLYAEKTGKSTHTYGPRWTELTNKGGRTKTITAGINPTKADKRNHTYMVIRRDSGNQWDVLYDFNTVGTTTGQLPVPRGNLNRIDVGLEVTGPQYVNVPAINSRMQFMDENRTWKRVKAANVAKSVTLPACNSSSKPPYCFTTKLTSTSGGFTQWAASKPRKSTSLMAPLAAPTGINSASAPASPQAFNGVDQQALQACMAEDPEQCLTSVPGLANCLATSRVCNAAALPSASERRMLRKAPAKAADIKARAAAAFHVPSRALTVTFAAASPRGLTGSASQAPKPTTWTVSSRESTPGLESTGRRYKGFTASYSADTGALLEACWGDLCPAR